MFAVSCCRCGLLLFVVVWCCSLGVGCCWLFGVCCLVLLVVCNVMFVGCRPLFFVSVCLFDMLFLLSFVCSLAVGWYLFGV